MSGFLWFIIVAVLTGICKTSHTRKETEVSNVYVSKINGTDVPSCGSISSPCRTIAMGVLQAKENARVYIDGTGSETVPYACKSSSLDLPGIHANKSLEIVGDQAMVHVKCQQGYDIRLNKSMSNNKTNVSLTNIKFIETSIQGEDVNIFIKDCIFANGKQGVNVVQSTMSITMLLTGSLCMNTSSCLVVNVTGQVQPTSKISIALKDSNIFLSKLIDNQSASAIHVTSTGDPPGSITCDIALHNVTLEQNTLGMKGLIFIDLMNAFTKLNFDTVTLKGNKVDTYTISLITIKECVDNLMDITNTKVIGNCGGFCRAVSLEAKKSVLTILNSSFEQFNVGTQSGVINLNSSNSSVYVDNSSFTNNNGEMGNGGCISVNSGTATVLIKHSSFTNNRGKDGGVLWISTKDYLLTNITNCHFKSNSAAGSGGVASIQSKEVHTILTDLIITDSTAGDSGGSFDIGNDTYMYNSPTIIENAAIWITNITVQRSSCINDGGVLALKAKGGLISIRDSVTNDTKAGAGGVAAITTEPSQQLGFAFEVLNTIFNFSAANNSCPTICAVGVYKLTMESVTVDNSYTPQEWVFFSSLSFSFYVDPTPIPTTNILTAVFTINNITIRKNKEQSLSSGLQITYATPLSLTLTNSVFESETPYFIGCLTLSSPNVNVLIHNVTFKGCYPWQNNIAGASIIADKANVIIDLCTFIDNVGGDGGAFKFVYFHTNRDKCSETVHRYSSKNYSSARNGFLNKIPQMEWSHNASILIKNTTFVNNTAITGGALSLSGGNTTIIGCNFTDNFAKYQGGHIYITLDSTSVRIFNSTFIQTGSTRTVFDNFGKSKYNLSNGLFIHSQSPGPLVVLNSTFESKLSRTEHVGLQTLISISKLNYIDFGDDNRTTIICPRGSFINILNYTNEMSTGETVVLSEMNCKPCQVDMYSLQHGRSLGVNKVSGFQCLPCPFGAECLGKITAKPNFWGFVVKEHPPQLNFTLCPVGYCNTKPRDNFIDYNSCQGNRAGALCGHCKENYSESLLSPSCCHDDDCHDNWLWGVAIAMAILMALYLIHKPRLGHILKNQILWFKCCRKEEDEQDGSQDHSSGGYLKVVFYFYQVVNILLVKNSYEKVIESYILHPVVGIFNFQFRFSLNGFLCPFPGLTAVTKQLLFASQVFGVLFMIAVCYCCHCILCKCRSRVQPNLEPYLGAVLETLLLGYAVFANTSLQLLRCTSLGGKSRLFIAGDVICYQWWQYVFMVFVGVVVFPFILTLAFGSHWLYKGTISVKEFLLGCVLPLPYLGYKLISYVCGPHRPNEEPPEWRTSVTRVLYGPFRTPQENTYDAMYWESILISRRLVLIIIYAFVTDSLTKELLLVLACVVILFHHYTVQPFRDTAANNAETVSLFGLFVIATMNTLKASFLSFGLKQKGPLQSLEDVFDWVQVFITTALPILFLVAVLVAVVSLAVRLILKAVKLIKCKGVESHDDNQRLLVPSPLT